MMKRGIGVRVGALICAAIVAATVAEDARAPVADAPAVLQIVVAGLGKVTATVRSPAADESGAADCERAIGSPDFFECTRLHYRPGRTVTVSAQPSPGSTFLGWSDPACGTAPTCAVTLPTSAEPFPGNLEPWLTTIAAVFSPVWLGVKIRGTGRVTSNPPGIVCLSRGTATEAKCSAPFATGSQVTFTATAGVEWYPRWCAEADVHALTCTVTAGRPTWVGAAFGGADVPDLDASGPDVFIRFRVGRVGTGAGDVQADGIDCGARCSVDRRYGSRLTLTATPQTGSRFAGWRGGGCAGSGATCSLTVGATTRQEAVFDLTTAPTPPPTQPPPTSPPRFQARILKASVVGHRANRTLVLRVSVNRAGKLSARIKRGSGSILVATRALPKGVTTRRLHVPNRATAGRYRLTVAFNAAGVRPILRQLWLRLPR
jgi:hypothetical protein